MPSPLYLGALTDILEEPYYFDELRYQKVTVNVHSHNEASILLHQKLGFIKEGTHRRMGYTKGGYFDVIWFGMTVEEFRASKS